MQPHLLEHTFHNLCSTKVKVLDRLEETTFKYGLCNEVDFSPVFICQPVALRKQEEGEEDTLSLSVKLK